jgi:hypothetical protein
MTIEFCGTVEEGQDVLGGAVKVAFPRVPISDPNLAMDRLFELFPDHEPALLSETEDCWIFGLSWNANPRTFVDPGVAIAAESLYGLSLSGIGSYHELLRWGECDVVTSMVHSWALLAPSQAVQRGKRPLSWVVHVDDHTDLMAPLVEPLSQGGSLWDTIFGKEIDLASPSSISAAIRRGILSKGNFLTAYLLAYPSCRAVHIGRDLAEQNFELRHRSDSVEIGEARFAQHGFSLNPVSEQEAGNFRQARSLPLDLPIGPGGVWLDIDLDYFCNRYNGDSDRRFASALLGERDEVVRRIQDFLCELRSVAWLKRVEAVSVAVSPAFFPSEYWAEAVAMVRDGVRSVLAV